ncbi:hypothetical protein BX666DRAFT_1900744 [Dichotomocladium elegans]|nr:hypothetical protein BX666DRAFT_1900744 [Dichotomocladium elegans]
MDTPPLEKPFPFAPLPSMSTPAKPAQHLLEKRPRRHTINRPDSALGHIPEACASEDDTEAFDRISGILSSLLQEAKDAIHGSVDTERSETAPLNGNSHNDRRHSNVQPLGITRNSTEASATTYSSENNGSHTRDSSTSSTFSSSATDSSSSIDTPNSLFAMTPPMTPKPVAPLSRIKKSARPLSCPMVFRTSTNVSATVASQNSTLRQAVSLRDPLAESYKRLDQSLAAVDSLSRDLVPREEASSFSSTDLVPSSSSAVANISFKLDLRWALLILPFLHILHAFISVIYDTLFSTGPDNLLGMLAWCILYCLASFAMDRAVISQCRKSQKQQQQQPRPRSRNRAFVPGSYATADMINPPISTQPAVLYPRRSNRRVIVLPRWSTVYRRLHSQPSPIEPTQNSLNPLLLKPSSSSSAIARSDTQPSCYMPATPTYKKSSMTLPTLGRRNSL